jgi:signal transduction histidine kinase
MDTTNLPAIHSLSLAKNFVKIKEPWLARVSSRFAQEEGVRLAFIDQLERFYDSLQASIPQNDYHNLAETVEEWIASRTQSEIKMRQSSLFPILDDFLNLLLQVSREELPADETVLFWQGIIPAFIFLFGYVSNRETDIYIEHLTGDLEQAMVRLEKMDKTKSDFIAIAAHELKTPLTLIEGYTGMLESSIKQPESGEQNMILLKGIENGTIRLRQITNDMIDISLIDNNLLKLHFQPIWMNKLIKSLIEAHGKAAQARKITFEFNQFPGMDEMFLGDEERLAQAFGNVFSNSIKYTPDGGRIEINGRKLPGFIEVTITDNGIGIDPEDQAMIFEKFGRIGDVALHSSGKTKFKGGGPGLGLPITRGIILAHGGSIWAESEGRDENLCPGSTFHILLPLRKEAPV